MLAGIVLGEYRGKNKDSARGGWGMLVWSVVGPYAYFSLELGLEVFADALESFGNRIILPVIESIPFFMRNLVVHRLLMSHVHVYGPS